MPTKSRPASLTAHTRVPETRRRAIQDPAPGSQSEFRLTRGGAFTTGPAWAGHTRKQEQQRDRERPNNRADPRPYLERATAPFGQLPRDKNRACSDDEDYGRFHSATPDCLQSITRFGAGAGMRQVAPDPLVRYRGDVPKHFPINETGNAIAARRRRRRGRELGCDTVVRFSTTTRMSR